MKSKTEIMLKEKIEQRILLIGGKRVMLDNDLARLYGVETKQLKRAVKRNATRFPEDFMFVLSPQEYRSLRCQIGTLEKGTHSKYLPYAFTEHGILMLSSVLNSERAININIHIMRVFAHLRELMSRHKDLEQRINALEKKYDRKFRSIFEAIRQLRHRYRRRRGCRSAFTHSRQRKHPLARNPEGHKKNGPC
jgi:phage regulator Rha-like protein